jgi:hypothetical protein
MVLLAACGGGRGYDALMHEADSLLTAGEVTSAYTLLAEADSQKTAWSRRQQMAYELLKAQAQNQAYVDFQTDSVLRIVARYYDRHGTHNERLKAHYLLGCTYRDLHEAPLALLSWEDAIASADTTAADCDYATLFRVYGQMADVYGRQHLSKEQLDCQQNVIKYALKAQEINHYIRGIELLVHPYYALGDTSKVYQVTEQARKLYIKHDMHPQAAQVYPTAICVAVEHGYYQRAQSMMQIYESESGLFDKDRNIIDPSRRQYHYYKGRYYLGVGIIDSAEVQFRKLLLYHDYFLDAYRGLFALYTKCHQTDSAQKYAVLYENELSTYLKGTESEAVIQAEGMYDYHRHERMAQEQKERAHEFELALISVVAVGIMVAMLVIWFFQKKKEEKLKVMELYSSALTDLNKARQDCELLQQSLSKKEVTKKLLAEKEGQIHELQIVVKKLRKQIGKSANLVLQQKLEESEIVKTFQTISHDSYDSSDELRKRIRARAATKREWKSMTEALQISHPALYLFIHKHNLSELKQKVCILSYLGFDTPTMATLIDAQPGSISNARTALARELFNLSSAHDLNRYLHEI